MRGINRVMLIGNLGRDPELLYIEGNVPCVKFPLATTETYKDRKGNLVGQTEWHNIVLWRGLAELAHKFLHKGSMVYVEGRLRTRTWEDKEKRKHSGTEIVCDNLVMLDRKKENGEASYSAEARQDGSVPAPDLSYDPNMGATKDDLPF